MPPPPPPRPPKKKISLNLKVIPNSRVNLAKNLDHRLIRKLTSVLKQPYFKKKNTIIILSLKRIVIQSKTWLK